MPASASPGGVKTISNRGTLSAVFAIFPILIVLLLTLPEPVARAGSSVLEIEPRLEADSHHPTATPSRKITSRETNKHCDGDKAPQDDDSATQDRKTGAQASQDHHANDP